MIPKTIHYCWFGHNPKPEIIEKCIASWRKYCPDWEIIEWNEDNWDVTRFSYAQEAYDAGKWAFVSDVARLDVLCKLGGVYLDTDVEILTERPFDSYIDYCNVMCFENARGINTGQFFACEKGAELCRRFLEPYQKCHYTRETQLVNTQMNEPIIRELLPNIKWNGHSQSFAVDGKRILIMGCEEYSGLMKHYGTRSWCENLPEYSVSKDNWLKRRLRKPERFEKLESSAFGRRILPIYTFLSYDLLDLGPVFYVKLFYNNHIRARFKP